jgi:hypothetical protein
LVDRRPGRAFGRERYASWTKLHQVYADLSFQILHLAAQGGLGDPKLRSGFGEVPMRRRPPKSIANAAVPLLSSIMPKSMAAQGTWYSAD